MFETLFQLPSPHLHVARTPRTIDLVEGTLMLILASPRCYQGLWKIGALLHVDTGFTSLLQLRGELRRAELQQREAEPIDGQVYDFVCVRLCVHFTDDKSQVIN